MEHGNSVNENGLGWNEQSHDKVFGYRRKALGAAATYLWPQAARVCTP